MKKFIEYNSDDSFNSKENLGILFRSSNRRKGFIWKTLSPRDCMWNNRRLFIERICYTF